MKKNLYKPINPNGGRAANGVRVLINSRRSINCLEDYMCGVEDRLEQLTNFQGWTLARMEDQEKLNASLKDQVEELFIFKDSVLHMLNSEFHAPVQVPAAPSNDEFKPCSSPTTPAPNTIHIYVARRASIPCPPGGLGDSSSSQECSSPDVVTKRPE